MTTLRYKPGYGQGGFLHADTDNYFEVSLIIDRLFHDRTRTTPKASSLTSLQDHAALVNQFIEIAKLYEKYKELATQVEKDREKVRAAKILEFNTEQYERVLADTQEEFLLKAGVLVKALVGFKGVEIVDSKPTPRLY